MGAPVGYRGGSLADILSLQMGRDNVVVGRGLSVQVPPHSHRIVT